MKNRALTSMQKREIIERLYLVWVNYNQLRLGQLIENALGDLDELYNIEDYELVEQVEKFYKEHDDRKRT